MMRWLIESIRKYSRRGDAAGDGAAVAPQAARPSCQQPRAGHSEKRRRKTPERVARRPDPDAWSEDELLGLHEAVALLWPNGPVTVSTLRIAIARGELAHARIANRIYVTLAALASCRRTPAASGAGPEVDWDAHLAGLLPKRGGRRG